MKKTGTLRIDADVATGEPCLVYIHWEEIGWFACISDWRLDIGTTGGVLHLIWDEDSESPPMPKRHSRDFKGPGPVYWPEQDMESLSNELSEHFGV